MHCSVVIATKDRAALRRARARVARRADRRATVRSRRRRQRLDRRTRAVVERHARERLAVATCTNRSPIAGKARNRGIGRRAWRLPRLLRRRRAAPPGWLAAHAAAHAGSDPCVVNGPILNVPSYERSVPSRGSPTTRAPSCARATRRFRPKRFHAAGGFDENFELYGWEDTELGLRLREAGLSWRFAWDAFLWHLKPPAEETLELQSRKAVERARMARRFLAKHPSSRARMATGAHPLNVLRARFLLPDALLAVYAGLATSPHGPRWLGGIARAAFLDGIYSRELVRALDASDE